MQNESFFQFWNPCTPQPKSCWYVPYLAWNMLLYFWQVKPGSWLERGDKRNRQSTFWSALWFLKIKVLRNQGLFQTLEKYQVLQTLIFFSGLHPEKSTLKSWVYTINTWKKNLPEIFLGFEIDTDISRPWFSGIRVQIKRPSAVHWAVDLHKVSKIFMKSHLNFTMHTAAILHQFTPHYITERVILFIKIQMQFPNFFCLILLKSQMWK